MRRLMGSPRFAAAGALIFVMALAVSALFSRPEAASCRCPLIYAPVTCDHGRTYSNQCVADCHNARNCVPSGVLSAR